MKTNIEFLQQFYFTFDLPVDYQLKNGTMIKIYPVSLVDSFNFLLSVNILTIDKNTSNDIDIIQMSYLQFLREKILLEEFNMSRFRMILSLCLHIETFNFVLDDKSHPFLIDVNNSDICINSKDFDEIKRIICYQNMLHYDDTYIPPDLKQAMDEVDEVKAKGFTAPSLERQISIITSHCGISKQEQMQMTLRSHSSLFEEVCGEVEYMGLKAIATYGGKGDNVEWIRPKAKGKYDGYFTSDEKYSKSMGGNGQIKMTNTNINFQT